MVEVFSRIGAFGVLRVAFLTALLMVFSFGAFAQSHKGLTFQGFLKDTHGNLVTSSGVTITSRLVSPNDCVLMSETHTGVNIIDGFFTVVIGKGVRSAGEPGLALKDVFSNAVPRVGLNPMSGAAGSCNYTPIAADARKLSLSFQIGADTIAADFNVRANAFSVWAESSEDASKLDGKSASAFLQTNVSAGLSQARLEEFIQSLTSVTGGAVRWNGANFVAYNPADATYLSSNSVTDTHIQSVAWSKLSGVPSGLAQIGGLSCADGKILKRVSGAWACADDDSGGGGGGGTVTAVSSTNAYLSVANGSTTPALTLNVGAVANTVAAGDDVRFNDATKIHGATIELTSPSNGQVLKYDGAKWVNSADGDLLAGFSCADGKILKRVTGAWACADESGVGTEVDPTVQAFAKNAPSTGLTVNGSNQLTVDFGTGAGKVVQGNDSRLTDARAPTGTATGDLDGSYPNPSVVALRGVGVAAGAPSSGNFLKYNGTNWDDTAIAISDVTNLSTQLGNKLDQSQMPASCAANQTLHFVSVTGSWTCYNIDSLNADKITAGTLNIARLPTGTTSSTVAIGNDSRFPASSCGSGNKMRWDGSAWQCETDNATDSTKVAKAGDTMTGALNLPSNGLAVGTDQLVVSGGSVGIGTTSPGYRLQLHTTNASEYNVMQITNSTTGATPNDGLQVGIGQNSQEAYVWNAENSFLQFGTSNTERVRITADGKVGIGTSNPSVPLHVVQNDAASIIETVSVGSASTAPDAAFSVAAFRNGNSSGYTNFLSFASGGTFGAFTPISAGTATGALDFRVNYATAASPSYQSIASVTAVTGANFNASDREGALLFSTSDGNASALSTEKMRITATGNVGIGTTAPADKLVVDGKVRATHICAPDGSNCKDTTTGWSAGGDSWTFVTQTSDVSISTADSGKLYQVAPSNNVMMLTLPSASAAGAGFKVRFVQTGTGRVHVYTSGGDSINGSSQLGLTLKAQNQSVTLASNGSGWITLETYGVSLPNMTAPDAYSGGYFVMGPLTKGDFGGLSGANALCLSHLQLNDWHGKNNALQRGILTAGKTRAFLCDATTCQNAQPSTTYKFSTTWYDGASYNPGTFVADASGLGPGDSANWQGAGFCRDDGYGSCAYLGYYWTGRSAGASTLWSGSPHGNTCTGWTVSASGSGRTGVPSNTNADRWSSVNTSCSVQLYLACFVDP